MANRIEHRVSQDAPPREEQEALMDPDGVEVAVRRLLLVDAGEQQGVVVKDGVGDHPGAHVCQTSVLTRDSNQISCDVEDFRVR